ncbi:MAG: tetratricopeptide repeat protein, partial [Thermoanaerobaculia bacterium]
MAGAPDLPSADPPGARQEAWVSGEGHVVVQIVGDGNTVVAGHPHLRLTRYLNRRLAEGEDRGEASLLSPYSLSVPLVGRETVLADLWTWLTSPQRISVRVLTATAGAGKTRLALALCEETTERGWAAGFLTDIEMERFRNQQNLSSWGWNRPTLIVVDYASARARTLNDWLIELADHPIREGPPLRLLLLERHAEPTGGWWREAFGVGGGDSEAVGRLLDPPTGPYALPGLVEPQERRAVLASILERVGSPVRLPDDQGFDHRLAEISWGGEPLFLLMAGLVAARAGIGEVLALSAPDLGFSIASHEIQRLHGIAESRNLKEKFFAHLAAYITLCQGLTYQEVESVIEEEQDALRYRAAGDLPDIFAALAEALPGEPGAVSPILPDVVGEAVILEAFGAARGEEKALLAMCRAAQRAQERVTASLVHLAQDYGTVRKEPLAWFARLAEERAVELHGFVSILDQLPDSSLVFRDSAAALTARAVELARKQDARETLAGALNNLSVRLSDLGRREEALTACEEAVAIRRQLAAARPDAFRPALASALNNLSVRLSDLGRREEALAACEEAVAILRQLAAARPDAFRPDLATSLNNLSISLSDLGRREEALAACEEAVAILRQLAAARPDAFRPDLATSLNNLSVRLSDLGRREEALTACEEAVAILRQLAAARPDAFRPALAMSLNNLSSSLSDLGRREEALAACEEASELYRQLAAARPDAFRPDLATSL